MSDHARFRIELVVTLDGESVDAVERWLGKRLWDVADVQEVQFLASQLVKKRGEEFEELDVVEDEDPWLDDRLQFARLIDELDAVFGFTKDEKVKFDLRLSMGLEEASDLEDLFRRARTIWDGAKAQQQGLGRLGPTIEEIEREEAERNRREAEAQGINPDEPDDIRYPPDSPADFYGV